jgi:hypothetical protein
MKYLKKFNEELKPQTYLSAARKLTKMGHTDRAEELKDWAGKVELRENLNKWKEKLEEFLPFGTFKFNVVNPESGEKLVGDFALDIHFDELSFEDEFESNLSSGNPLGYFSFFMGIIPTSEELLQQCEQLMPTPDLDNGFYWSNIFSIKFTIVNGEVKFTGFEKWDYDDSLSGEVSFADRQSAQKFKNLLKSCITDRESDYPSGYNNARNMQEVMERSILVRQSFSSEYGFQLEDIANYVNSISANELYKTL